MKKLALGYVGLDQYDTLTEAEKLAWLNPEQHSYHSFHVERMGENTYRWRDSKTAHYYIGTLSDLATSLCALHCRRLDPEYENRVQVLTILSQSEVDDLLSDL